MTARGARSHPLRAKKRRGRRWAGALSRRPLLIALLSHLAAFWLGRAWWGRSAAPAPAAVDLAPAPQTGAVSLLQGTRVLLCIVAFDLEQMIHLESMLDAAVDACEAGADVAVRLYAAEAWPERLQQLIRHRAFCSRTGQALRVELAMKERRDRLFITNHHRPDMYALLDDFDLFVYAENDMLIPARTLAAYLQQEAALYDASVEAWEAHAFGFLRYERNASAVDDDTRASVRHVKRVFWEQRRPLAKTLPIMHIRGSAYARLTRAHSGVWMGTRRQLVHWRDKCGFHEPTRRPGKGGQPASGTQRVWMAGRSLFDRRFGCGIEALVPLEHYQAFALHHLSDKNFRRVGRKGRLGGRAAKEPLVTAEELFEHFLPDLDGAGQGLPVLA